MSALDYEFNLGTYERRLEDVSEASGRWFNLGLNWLFGFNHDEAVLCFQNAIEADPNNVLAYWGTAYAIGPNYNKLWEMFVPPEKAHALQVAKDAIEAGLARSAGTDAEKAMLAALQVRYPNSPEEEDFGPYNDAFAEAMREVYKQHSHDLDVACVFAEALMGRTPWQLWNLVTGEPNPKASTVEAREVLEGAFENDPNAWSHPGMLHLYIHLMEMSPTPELALPHGDNLSTLVPDSGHLQHMATHIDVLCGEYQNVIHRNHQAALVDLKYSDLRGGQNFYTVYRIHNTHFEAYGAMFLGQKATALRAAEDLKALLPVETVAFLPDLFEAFWGVKTHVMVRFGMWQEILEEPLPEDSELFSFTTALLRYGRTIALANSGKLEDAKEELAQFMNAKNAVQETRQMFNNPAASVLEIAAEMAFGEYHYKNGEIDKGLDHLREAANFSDNLLYDEPWGWMQPPRHALAALLMEQARYDEAEEIYRSDLGLVNSLPRPCQHPGNIWAMQGLHECLERRGETAERVHVKNQLDKLKSRADVAVGSSCFCRTR